MNLLSLYSTATQKFSLAIPTCWYPKTLKFALPPTQILKFALPPTRNPNASQWNIGCVGSQTQIPGVGHVHFIFFVSISFALGSQFPVEYGLKYSPEFASLLSFQKDSTVTIIIKKEKLTRTIPPVAVGIGGGCGAPEGAGVGGLGVGAAHVVIPAETKGKHARGRGRGLIQGHSDGCCKEASTRSQSVLR